MPQIQVDQRKIHVLYLVTIIKARQSIPWLSGYDAREALIQIWRSGFHSGKGCHLLLFLLNYFCMIIYIYIYIYIYIIYIYIYIFNLYIL